MSNFTLSFHKAVLSDYDDFFLIKKDQMNVAWGGFVKEPDYVGLKIWYEQQIISGSREIFLVDSTEKKNIAFFYIDKISEDIYEAAS